MTSTPPASTARSWPRSCSARPSTRCSASGSSTPIPHPGNIFAFRDGSLGLIDFGAVGRLDPIQQAAVVDILAALMRRDVSLLRDGIERVAEVHNADRPEELERALARLLADHVRATGAVDPSVLQDLVAMLARFGIRLPTDLVVLSRALVTLDGTLRVLAPEMSLVTAATESMTSATAPAPIDRDEMIRDEMLAALPHLRRLPDRIDRILTLTSRGELRVRSIVDEDAAPHPAHPREPGVARGHRDRLPGRRRRPARCR